MRHRGLLQYLAVCIVIAVAALVASYKLWTSDAWFWAYGAKQFGPDLDAPYRNHGGILEGIRILLLCAFFYLVMTRMFPEVVRYAWGRSWLPRRLWRWTGSGISRLGLVLWVAGLAFVPVFHLWLAPQGLAEGFRAEVLGTASLPPTPAFARYFLPYLLYMPYSVCTYLLVAIPLMLMLVIAIQHDRRKLRTLLQRVEGRGEESPREAAGRLRVQIDYLYGNLRRVMNRYGWVLLALAIYYSIEFFTPMFDTLSCPAQATTSWAAWIFAPLILLYFFARTYRRFSRGGRAIRRALDRLRRRALKEGDDDAVGELDDVRDRLQPDSLVGYLTIWRQTSVVLVVGILIALGITTAVWKEVSDQDIRETVNVVLPPGVDYGVIWMINLFSEPQPAKAADSPAAEEGEAPAQVEKDDAGEGDEVFRYQPCFENQAPADVVEEFARRRERAETGAGAG